ncbi:MAG: outer membrane protein transport protein [Calditrichia bacterium]
MKTSLFIITILTCLIAAAWSQTTGDAVRIRQDELGLGARNLAMGGTGVVLTNDYSAIYWNPAGLSGLSQSQFMGEISHLRFSNQALFAGNQSDMGESYNHLRTLGLAIPLPTTRGSLVLAFGYNFVKDFDQYLYFTGINNLSNGLGFELDDGSGVSRFYNFDTNVSQTEEVADNGGLHQWSFGGAMALSPNFDLGVSMNFWQGKDEYSLNFRQLDDANVYNVFPADFDSYAVNQNLITNYSAFSLKLGGMFKMNQFTRLGLAMEFPTTFKVKENFSTSDELVFDDGYTDAIQDEPGIWEYKVRTPYRFDAGLGIQTERVSLAASATYQDWSQTRFEKPDEASLGEDYGSLLEENFLFAQNYRETINYHLGGELSLPGSNMFLRAGYAFFPTPLKDAPPELDKKYYSGGLGFRVGGNTYLDVTYLRGSWKRQSEDSYTPGGTLEDITENRFLAGIRYAF